MQITESTINSALKGLGIDMSLDELKQEGETVPFKLQYLKKYLDLINYKVNIIKDNMDFKYNKTQLEVMKKLRNEIKELKRTIEDDNGEKEE